MRTRISEKCTICGEKYYAKGLCKFHYQRKKQGVKEEFPKLKKENEYEIIGDVAIVYYQGKERTTIGSFKIDKEDIDKIRKYKWSILSTGYISTYVKKRLCFFIDF